MAILKNMIAPFTHWIRLVSGIALLSLTAACSTLDVGAVPPLEPNARWGLLPFVNHTETPQAGLRAESITEAVLRANGIANLRRYPSSLNTETLFEPMDRKQLDAARAWAQDEGIRYALTGSVDEWRYKVGVDGEPAAGITLQLIDVPRDEVIWSATGGRTGWSREALSAVAQKLIRTMAAPVVSGAR